MRKTRCRYGHYFDEEAYVQCPLCDTAWSETASDTNRVREQLAREYLLHSFQPGGNRGSIENRKPIENRNPIVNRTPIGNSGNLNDPIGEENPETEWPTVSLHHRSEGNYFAVGCLTCFEGADVGHSWFLYEGQNLIGAGARNDIRVLKDRMIGEKHASIIYETIRDRFYLRPFSGYKLLLEGEEIREPVPLENGACIGMGECRMRFVQFRDNAQMLQPRGQ